MGEEKKVESWEELKNQYKEGYKRRLRSDYSCINTIFEEILWHPIKNIALLEGMQEVLTSQGFLNALGNTTSVNILRMIYNGREEVGLGKAINDRAQLSAVPHHYKNEKERIRRLKAGIQKLKVKKIISKKWSIIDFEFSLNKEKEIRGRLTKFENLITEKNTSITLRDIGYALDTSTFSVNEDVERTKAGMVQKFVNQLNEWKSEGKIIRVGVNKKNRQIVVNSSLKLRRARISTNTTTEQALEDLKELGAIRIHVQYDTFAIYQVTEIAEQITNYTVEKLEFPSK